MQVPWGAWRPDTAGPDTGMAQTADGVLPQSAGQGIGYGPMPALETQMGAVALGESAVGSISLQTFDGSWQVYFATPTKIRQLTSTYDWSDIETGRTVTDGDDVSFVHFGSYLLNSDTTDGFKAYNVETPAGNNAVSGAPSARALFTCNNVVFALDCNGNNRRMQSSAVGDHTNWTSEGADGKTFEDGGALIGGRDLKNGSAVIFQEHAIRLVTFGGMGAGSALYSIAKVSDGIGAIADRSIVAFDGAVYWLAADGLYRMVSGGAPEPIGAGKVNRWLARQLAASDYKTVQGALDPYNKIVTWRLDGTRLLAYDLRIGEFITHTVATTSLAAIATAGYTLEDLDDFGTLDALSASLDARQWQGNAPVFGALDADGKFAIFSGESMQATLRSCVLTAGGSKRFLQATPISDAPNSTLSIGTSDRLTAALSYSDPATRNEDGNVMLDDRGRMFAFEEVIPAGDEWTFSNGVDGIVANQDAP